METKIIYCELETLEQARKFEDLLNTLGVDFYDRPMRYASHTPVWVKENRKRANGEDPLAAIMLYSTETKSIVLSGYRCDNGERIEPELMESFINFLIKYNK